VIRSVAKAIDGAAPNRAAKLGRNMSPSIANAETATPPTINRKRYYSTGFAPIDIFYEEAFGRSVRCLPGGTAPPTIMGH
jgi:hypothetical protein